MQGLSTGELQNFADTVDGVLSSLWPQARIAGEDRDGSRLRALWQAGARLGWTALAADRALDAVVTATARLGRTACPLPLMDVYVTATLLPDDGELVRAIETGDVRPVVASRAADSQSVRFTEAGRCATHMLLVLDGEVVLREITAVSDTPGLARPDWADATLSGAVTRRATPGRDATEQARALLRLGLAARAVGAAERAVELSIAHAKERVAFGRPIGSFQAVSHRAVDGATDMTAAKALIREAVESNLADRTAWPLAAEIAVQFAAPAAVSAQFGAHHTLAAAGYFEEHDAPWLFRRVNADVSALDGISLRTGEVADMLISSADGLPPLELGERAEQFRSEVRRFSEPFRPTTAVVHFDDRTDQKLRKAAVERGYLTLSWPASAGGREATVEEQMVLNEELAYQRIHVMGKGAADMLGRAIIRHGSPEQQARYLPLIASGNFPFYLGYSEPEVGSDLANLRTTAVRDGDGWIVNGRKMWGTGAHRAEWVWLATRTDPQATPPHSGITVFLTRVDRPGFEIRQHTALSGEIACSTFFDNFRVPDADRIGEVNGGWKVIAEALAHERVAMANTASHLLRLMDDMLAEVRKDPEGTVGATGSAKRRAISELAARLQASRVLLNASVRATAETGGGARLEAPMAKILATQLLEDFCEAALRIFGPAAALGEHVPGVPGRGAFEYNLRFSIMQVVGGGTIDIQRNLVARALGLPR
ncbi:acyl-CoA dehydrogenase family protein [Dactylosporangium sp. AC04546]|uniref:acyl-CoA dehydrogenase family protein n=1 Tax=Dactylosporangium sp. AC04546 TaxID=2862460 RepID=UPI001EDCD40E|nr:acyl-CoA dehydrogenase family protein [Dactylosporangium sp. AC04546]WVK86921.1 acyl-CoA dehydrogenase family protein [Dactylosporangium sp. AC04546]